MKTCSLFYTALAVTLFVSPLAHAKDDFVGTFGNWHVQTYVEGGSKVCLMWSQPEKSKGKYKRRGDIYAYVTQRPAAKRLNEISISIGYKFQKGSALSVSIGKSNLTMFTDGDTAWNRNPLDEAKMVKAMRASAKMTVRGMSSRGTKTTDEFSLKGFTKAYAAMNQKCGIGKKKKKS